MSATLNYAVNPSERESSARTNDLTDRILDHTGPLPQLQLMFEADLQLLWLVMRPEPKPVFTMTIIESVLKVQKAIATIGLEDGSSPIAVAAFRTAGPFFSLGGDLDYYLDCLDRRDAEGLRRYAEVACEVIQGNRSGFDGNAVTLSAVHARALGGGIDPACACHLVVAEESATFCYPEITYNHFPIAAVPILARRVGSLEAERILLSGESYTATQFRERGAIEEVVADGASGPWVRDFVRKSVGGLRARLAIGAAFDRLGGNMATELSVATGIWVNHMMSLNDAELGKLRRISRAQEMMLRRQSA